uniref:Uncharacterized protein n=1 Tax=Xiphophorus couchianus TaxID=32473 RepID=A0A3B5MW23_9TELE
MGQGTFTWLDGSTYTGDISRGIRHGRGTYKCPRTGMSYSGQWDHSKRHGKVGFTLTLSSLFKCFFFLHTEWQN